MENLNTVILFLQDADENYQENNVTIYRILMVVKSDLKILISYLFVCSEMQPGLIYSLHAIYHSKKG